MVKGNYSNFISKKFNINIDNLNKILINLFKNDLSYWKYKFKNKQNNYKINKNINNNNSNNNINSINNNNFNNKYICNGNTINNNNNYYNFNGNNMDNIINDNVNLRNKIYKNCRHWFDQQKPNKIGEYVWNNILNSVHNVCNMHIYYTVYHILYIIHYYILHI